MVCIRRCASTEILTDFLPLDLYNLMNTHCHHW